MTGREDRQANDVFFACSLIEYLGRTTHNHRDDVARALGRERVAKLYDLADVYHCESIDAVAERFADEAGIVQGDFDDVAACRYAVPSHWDIGKVYKRLVLGIMAEQGLDAPDAILAAFGSGVSRAIEDFNSAFYYDNPHNILDAYLTGQVA